MGKNALGCSSFRILALLLEFVVILEDDSRIHCPAQAAIEATSSLASLLGAEDARSLARLSGEDIANRKPSGVALVTAEPNPESVAKLDPHRTDRIGNRALVPRRIAVNVEAREPLQHILPLADILGGVEVSEDMQPHREAVGV